MKSHRKIITRVIVFVFLGVIVNVAVAWACALWINAYDHGHGNDERMADTDLPQQFHWFVRRRDAFGATRMIAQPRAGNAPTTPDQPVFFPAWCDLRSTMRQGLAEANSLPRPANASNPPRPLALIEDARGWPFRALRCHWDYGIIGMTGGTPPNSGPLQTGIELATFGGQLNAGGLDYARALPYSMLWLGFANNTLFYAGILWLLFAAPFALRRRTRIRRGLCPACAYPVGDSDVCTECGKAVTSR